MATDSTSSSGTDSGAGAEKYIRTFANDMSIFQKGGTPGLAPLTSHAPLPAERLIAPSPIAAEPAPVAAPEPAPAPEPIVPPQPEASPTPIQTYAGDFRARMKETSASTTSIVAAEQDAPRAPSVPASTEASVPDSRNLWYIIGGAALLIIGLIGIYFSYSKYLATNALVTVAPTATTPIFVDSREQVAGTGTALMQAVVSSVGKPLTLNTVRLLSYDTATDASVFGALGLHAPGALLRNLSTAGSMAGIVSAGSGQSPFFILAVTSYSATFSGMLSWESTMQSELAPLFPLYPPPFMATSTSTTTPEAPSVRTGFRDEVVSNHDVRVYRDATGRSILIYGYWNQGVFVIARDPAAFTEILARLATSHS